MERLKTVVLGASTNPDRASYRATLSLARSGEIVIPVGIREGHIGNIPILTNQPDIEEVDTLTLYVGPRHQPGLYDYILSLQPRRIIFNPGTENPELFQMAEERGISAINACTLVMVALNDYHDRPSQLAS